MFRRVFLVVLVGAAVLFGPLVAPASAGTVNFSGTLDGSDPTMPVVFISPPVCTGQGATLVAYESKQFTVDTAGVYTFSLTLTGNLSMYLFAGSFNPAAAFPTCVAADNADPIEFSYGLVPGTTYFAVVFDDSFTQDGGTYTATISGPGNILLGGAAGGPGPDMIPLPPTAVVGAFVVSTPIYFAPRADAVTTIIMEAGKTVWVFGLDESGQYYKAAISGQYFWVPRHTLGPNYDEVWLGRPLPTITVE